LSIYTIHLYALPAKSLQISIFLFGFTTRREELFKKNNPRQVRYKCISFIILSLLPKGKIVFNNSHHGVKYASMSPFGGEGGRNKKHNT